LKLVYFETLDQFSPSSFEIRRFSPFNQILLGLCFVHIPGLYLSYLYCLTHLCFNVKSNTIMKQA